MVCAASGWMRGLSNRLPPCWGGFRTTCQLPRPRRGVAQRGVSVTRSSSATAQHHGPARPWPVTISCQDAWTLKPRRPLCGLLGSNRSTRTGTRSRPGRAFACDVVRPSVRYGAVKKERGCRYCNDTAIKPDAAAGGDAQRLAPTLEPYPVSAPLTGAAMTSTSAWAGSWSASPRRWRWPGRAAVSAPAAVRYLADLMPFRCFLCGPEVADSSPSAGGFTCCERAAGPSPHFVREDGQ
jgi:hypothetical protein